MGSLAKEAILNAFIQLVSKRPFDQITVQDVVDECHVSRRTFYYHYRDLYGVIEALLNRELEKAVRIRQEQGNWQESFINASKFILENKQAVYHLYHSVHRDEMLRYIDRVATGVMQWYMDEMCRGRNICDTDKQLIGSFYKNALTGVLREWLDSGLKTDPEAAVRRLGILFEDNIRRSLDKSEQY